LDLEVGQMRDQRGILAHESALEPEARAQIAAIGQADVVIGIPSHRNGRTIAEVVQAISDGVLRYLMSSRVVLMNADGGSSDNTVRHLDDAWMPPNVTKLLTTYPGSNGKGSAIRAIFEATGALGARVCVILEARAPGITPEWIKALVDPILTGADVAIPCFQRSSYTAALVDNLCYPFMRMFLDTDLRQPLMSEFSVSGALAREMADTDVWETDVARYGINVWVPIQALAEGRRIAQVDLGYRGDQSGDPGAALDARFLHTVSTLFRLLTVHRRLWMPVLGATDSFGGKNARLSELPPRRIAFAGDRCPERVVPTEIMPCTRCIHELLISMGSGAERHGELWQHILQPPTLDRVDGLLECAGKARASLAESLEDEGHPKTVSSPSLDFEFPIDLWRDIVIEFAVAYNQGEGDPDKVIESLLPLFYGRSAFYMLETEGLDTGRREAVVEGIVRAFIEARPIFLEQWNRHQSWPLGSPQDEDSIYWLT
jgi:hypothetical protein